MLTLSYTQMSMMNCPRKWELAYGEGYQRKPNMGYRSRYFGTAFHEGMKAVLLRLASQGVAHDSNEELLLIAREAVNQAITNETAPDVRTYEGLVDVDYYAMMDSLKHEVFALLEWFVPVSELGSRYHVASVYDVFGTTLPCGDCDGKGHVVIGKDENGYDEFEPCFSCVDYSLGGQVPDNTPMVEWAFEYDLNEEVRLHGIIDAVLYDSSTDSYLMVDWKTRKSVLPTEQALIDGQLPLYAAVIQELGAIVPIDSVRMWQVRSVPPAPATINKKPVRPSIANNAKATTFQVWYDSLPADLQKQFGDDNDFVATVQSIKDISYFSHHADAYVTEDSHTLAMANIHAQAEMIKHYNTLYEADVPLPAIRSSYNCKSCPFMPLCNGAFAYGGDASIMLDEMYERREGYEPEDVED